MLILDDCREKRSTRDGRCYDHSVKLYADCKLALSHYIASTWTQVWGRGKSVSWDENWWNENGRIR